MAKPRFLTMKLDLETIRAYYEDGNFARLVFQPEMAESENNKEFTLIVYPINAEGNTMSDKITLEPTEEKAFKPKSRLELGNIPMSKNQLSGFFDEGVTSMYFIPFQFGDYVAYLVKDKLDRFKKVETQIKPSPPAPPEP